MKKTRKSWFRARPLTWATRAYFAYHVAKHVSRIWK